MQGIGSDVDTAKRILEEGGLVAIPTETVYGLAANALDPDAVLSVFEVKERPSFDPLIVHVASKVRTREVAAQFPEMADVLADHFWPGPLTLLLPKTDAISDIVTSGMPRVAIRVPNHPVTERLLNSVEFPLVAPSANPFGYVSPTSAGHVQDQMGDRIDYILDGGPCQVGIESTILGFEEDRPTIYRLGGVSVEEISELVGKPEVKPHSSSEPKAPGMLKSHYSPKKEIIVGNLQELVPDYESRSRKIGIIHYRMPDTSYGDFEELVLSDSGDLHEAARNLFTALRKLDDSDIDLILAEPAPDEGLGKAINDRLTRAAAP